MKKFTTIALAALLLVLIGYRIVTHGEEPAIKDIDAYQAELGVPVEVERVLPADLMLSRHFTGTIEGASQADAIANTTQRIVAIPVKVGDTVQQGQMVAKLDFNIASNMSLRYRQTKAGFEDARRDYERMQSLYAAGAISQQALDKTKVGLEIARRNFEAATKLVKIEAPISGVVTHIYPQIGETIRSGMPVVRIATLDPVMIKIDINETEITGIERGQKASIEVAAYPGEAFPGVLENLSISADPRTRTFQAWVRTNNPEGKLKPGMFAKVEILVTAKKNVLTVSKDALVQEDGKEAIYVVSADSVAELREIKPGQGSGNRVEVISGLQENERVVVLGQNKLRPGRKVNIVN